MVSRRDRASPRKIDNTLFGYESPPDQRTPHRDVLKWVQGLDLSHPLRNVRRDLTNGFMAAEILSRYFPQDVQMHSFENATCSHYKKDNWEQIRRLIAKKGMDVPDNLIDGTMSGQYGAAADFLDLLYEILNQRKLPEPEPLPTDFQPQAMAGLMEPDSSDANKQEGRMGGRRVTKNVKASAGVEFGNINIKTVPDAAALRRTMASNTGGATAGS